MHMFAVLRHRLRTHATDFGKHSTVALSMDRWNFFGDGTNRKPTFSFASFFVGGDMGQPIFFGSSFDKIL